MPFCAIAYATDFARERKTFGQPLINHQAIQMMMADAAIGIEAARHLVYYGAALVDQGKYERQYAPHLSIAKTFATEMANKVASDALQVLGAQGYMKDHPLERHYRCYLSGSIPFMERTGVYLSRDLAVLFFVAAAVILLFYFLFGARQP